MIYRTIDNEKDKWIVLIHCVCGNEHIFDLQISDLNKQYNIIVVRLEGHGIQYDLINATMQNVVEEIHAYIITKQILKIDILGLSLGAMISHLYVEMYPETVDKVYLTGMIYNFSCNLFWFMYSILIKIKEVIPRFVYMYLITYILLPRRMDVLQRKKLYKFSKKMSKKYLYSWMNEMYYFMKDANYHMNNILKSKVKILYVYGEYDKLFLNYTKKSIESYMNNNIKLVTLKEAGHICNISNANEFNNILIGGR